MKLYSEDENVSLEINLGEPIAEQWLGYELLFNYGEAGVDRFSSEAFSDPKTMESEDPFSDPERIGRFVFALKPQNRFKLFVNLLEKFMRNPNQAEFVFEPADPSFELIIQRSHANGFKVYAWVDLGNSSQARYTWDARGLRFYTTAQQLEAFLLELKA